MAASTCPLSSLLETPPGSRLPAPLRPLASRLSASLHRFRSHYALVYSEERIDRLLESLAAPTAHAAIPNSFSAVRSSSPQSEHALLLPPSETAELAPAPGASIRALLPPSGTGTGQSFLPASPDGSGIRTHYLLDLASVLPIEALDVRPGHKVLDLCAAPGGKSVVIAQYLFSDDAAKSLLHSNEVDKRRCARLRKVLGEYLAPDICAPSSPSLAQSRSGNLALGVSSVDVTASSGSSSSSSAKLGGSYDRVLVDAPCSSERHLVHSLMRGIQSGNAALVQDFLAWAPSKSARLAKTQKALLRNAIGLVKKGGRVVYATCSLSRDENDGVVEGVLELLRKKKKKDGLEVRVVEPALGGWEGERTGHGWLVLPDRGNWGPIYCAVLERIR